MKTARANSAVTLIELLVVIVIIAVLAGIVVPVVGSVQKQGRLVRETSAARQVIAAYLAAAADDNGALLAGYDARATARDDRGNELNNPSNARYPWRLAPYLSYDLGVLYGKVGDDRLKADREREHSQWVYAVSVAPAFGMNTVYVGGDFGSFNPDNPRALRAYGSFCVRNIAQAVRPQLLVVFATACFESDDKRVPGYFKVEAPSLTSRRWNGSYDAKAPPSAFGHVDFRYDDRAICAMLDGHVELLDFETLDDMRRWSNQAADLNTQSFALGSP